MKKVLQNLLTNVSGYVIIVKRSKKIGSIAQLGEHLPYKQRVIGSSPVVPTSGGAKQRRCLKNGGAIAPPKRSGSSVG